MKYIYKSVKYTSLKWKVLKELSDVLSLERGTKVSLADASVEAAKRLLDERIAAGTPSSKAQEKGVITE